MKESWTYLTRIKYPEIPLEIASKIFQKKFENQLIARIAKINFKYTMLKKSNSIQPQKRGFNTLYRENKVIMKKEFKWGMFY